MKKRFLKSQLFQTRKIFEKDGVELAVTESDGAIMFLERQQTLRILVARPEHSGKFTCIAENVAGKDEATFDVSVHRPPTIITKGREVSGVEGSRLQLQCEAEGFPKPEIRWRRDGAPIDLAGVLMKDEKLMIPSLLGPRLIFLNQT